MAPGCSNNNIDKQDVNKKQQSWASEVEDEQDANGWSLEQGTDSSSSFPAYPGSPAKAKKNKKKKNNNKNNKSLTGKPEKEAVTESSSNSNHHVPAVSHLEDEFRRVNVSDIASGYYDEDKNDNDDEDDGWQVSSSRKSKHKIPPSNNSTYIPPSNNSFVPPSNNSFVPWSSNSKDSYVPPANNNYMPPSNSNHYPPRPVLSSVRPPVRPNSGFITPPGPRPHQAPTPSPHQPSAPRHFQPPPARPSNPWQNQHQNTRPRDLNDVPPNVVECESSSRRQWRPQAPLPQKGWAVENQVQMNENNILTKLLPSERGPEIQAGNIGGKGASGARTANQVSFPPPDLQESSFPADSDSACSDGDLDDDSDWIGSDGFDSDASVKSLETKKRNKWFVSFFQTLDSFTNEQIMDQDRQWHCPACQGGVGAIDWYRGLQPLITHAKTQRTKRVGLHREFAKVLEEDLEVRRAGTGGGETKFGKWKGLQTNDTSKMVLWPPMVVIQNTRLETDEQEKWIGMGNKELLDMFKDYNPMKARHSYGPYGHRGISVVIFTDSPTGYFNAKRLAKQFKDSLRGRIHWHQRIKGVFNPVGERILYGYMAKPEDMEDFNKHCSGKGKLKWEHKRFVDAVAQPLKQMDEDNQQLNYYKVKMQKQKEHSKTLEKSMSIFARKLESREQEISKIRERAKLQHEENQKEMKDLEETYNEKISDLHKESARREEEVHKKQEDFKLEHMERCQELEKKLGEEQQQPQVKEAIARQTDILNASLRDTEDYEEKKRELKIQHFLRKREFYREHYIQLMNLENEFKNEMDALLEKYDIKQGEKANS